MPSQIQADLRERILLKAGDLGASLAGIAAVSSLQASPSYQAYDRLPYYEGYAGADWPAAARSVLVLGLVHDPAQPELDWWDYHPGRTRGNRRLIAIAESVELWMRQELGIGARPLAYRVEQGGILLKDAAVLAGLGAFGRNNLVITPQFGPRVRWRALFLDVALKPTGPADYDPCAACDMPCRRACPQDAFVDGAYSRARCDRQMEIDEANEAIIEGWVADGPPARVRKYCRACELACPVGRRSKSASLPTPGGEI
jgi:epoxyqueuosine reductase